MFNSKIKFALPLSLLFFAYSCKIKTPQKYPEISFNKDTFNLGQLKSGDTKIATYKFTNIGTTALKINDVGVSCGCTKVNFDTTDILPNKQGYINVTFSSGSDTGYVLRSVVVNSNSLKKLYVLYLEGKVAKY